MGENGAGKSTFAKLLLGLYHPSSGRILVLERGALTEEGSHAALLAANGRYADLYRLQAAWYR